MIRTVNLKTLLISFAATLGSGAIAALFSRNASAVTDSLRTPPLYPPGWLFTVVWSILYVLLGISLYLALNSGGKKDEKLIAATAVSLIMNLLWPLFFFVLRFYGFSAFWIAAMLIAAVITAIIYTRYNRLAGILMLPYIVWLMFALYLNVGVAVLN